MKAIHNKSGSCWHFKLVVLYPKDTEKWKQFTTPSRPSPNQFQLCCIPKILKNESNSQQWTTKLSKRKRCVVSQRYWKMKAIHNSGCIVPIKLLVVLYPKDTEKWKQFTTIWSVFHCCLRLCCIPKILKNESNSQRAMLVGVSPTSCVVSQRYWKMKAIHNNLDVDRVKAIVVLYPKDTEKWKQFTTVFKSNTGLIRLCCIPKILKNESNSQRVGWSPRSIFSCVVSQRYWKMKAIHNFFNVW